jgi:hypothetical protein
LNVKINGAGVQMQVGELIHALMHYNTGSKLKTHSFSLTPTYPDQSQEYADLQGSIRNPLGFYGDSNDENVMGRGGFTYNIVRNDGSGAIIDCVFTENLYMNPFYFGSEDRNGFVNVQVMDFNINFITNAWARMWSHDDTLTTITGGSVAFNNFGTQYPWSYPNDTVPQLLFKYVTPQDLQVIPRNQPYTYPYYDIQRYITTYGTIAPGASVPINSNNIRFNSIPRRIFVFVRNNNNTMESNCRYTDSYAAITGVNINWGNRNSLLATANQEQLYAICLRNGCDMSYTQWAGIPVYKTGSFSQKIAPVSSVLCINPSIDLGLGELEAAGVSDDINFQIRVNVTNYGANSMNADLYIVCAYEGTFTITGYGSAETQTAVLSRMDVLDAQQSPAVNYSDVQDSFGAGNFLSGLKDMLKDTRLISSVGKFAGPLLSANPQTAAVGPAVSALANAAENYGYGDGEGAMLGGRRMRKSSLKSRIRHY